MKFRRLELEGFSSPLARDLTVSKVRMAAVSAYAQEALDEESLSAIEKLQHHYSRTLEAISLEPNISVEIIPNNTIRQAVQDAFGAVGSPECPIKESEVPAVKRTVELLRLLRQPEGLERHLVEELLQNLKNAESTLYDFTVESALHLTTRSIEND